MAQKAGELSVAFNDREAAEDIVRRVNRTYENEETNRDVRVALRMFGKRVTDGEDVPDSIWEKVLGWMRVNESVAQSGEYWHLVRDPFRV